MMKNRPPGWLAFANLSDDGFREMRVWDLRQTRMDSFAVKSKKHALSEYMCDEQCVYVYERVQSCVAIRCACVRCVVMSLR